MIDLRSLSPYDWEAIAESVRKTNRVIVAQEDMLSWGYGAEIAARVGDELFHDLDAPVRRVAAMDTFCGVSADSGGCDPAAAGRFVPGDGRTGRVLGVSL